MYFDIRKTKKIVLSIIILCIAIFVSRNCKVYADDNTDNNPEDYTKYKTYDNTDKIQNIEYDAGKFANKQKMITVDGFEYIIVDGEAAVSKYVGNDKNVTIPANVNGIPVVLICQDAFYCNDTVESIIISEGIKNYIEGMATSCSNLQYIYFSSTINDKFSGEGNNVGYGGTPVIECLRFEKIEVAKNNPYFCVKNGILYDKKMTKTICCPSALKTKKIVVPKSVVSIQSASFSYNQYVEEVVLPESVDYIGYWSFQNSNKLKKINIPEKCSFIGQYAFWGTSLEKLIIPKNFKGFIMTGVFTLSGVKISVEKGNTRFKVINNCFIEIFEKNTELLYYMDAYDEEQCIIPDCVNVIGDMAFMFSKVKRIRVPESVYYFGYMAFMYCSELEDINIPKLVKGIDEYTFCECRSLGSLIIPKNVEKINKYAFSCSYIVTVYIPESVKYIGEGALSCNGLHEVYYEGIKKRWDKIAHNDVFSSEYVKIHYNFKLISDSEPYFAIPKINQHNVIKRKYNGVTAWYYVKNGKVDNKFTGFASNEYGWWYVEKGKVRFDKNDIIKGKAGNIQGWWYVKNGKIQFVDTVAKNEKGWWRIHNGRINFGYTGIAKNENAYWYIKNGRVDFGYTGFASNDYGWWYFKNGKIDFNKKDIVSGVINGVYGWWYIDGGKVQFVSSVEKNANGWWSIKFGKVDFEFSGIAKNENGYWCIENGRVNFGFTGVVWDDAGWLWYCSNGKVQFDYNGYYEQDRIKYKITDGKAEILY